MGIMILPELCLAMVITVCVMLSGLFYSTPDLGFDEETGTLNCFCFLVAKTSPHFPFLLQILTGLLSLTLCMRVGGDVFALVLTVLFNISLTGLFSFDVVSHKIVHLVFLLLIIIISLIFSTFILDWVDGWHKAGMVVYSSTSVIFLFMPLVLYYMWFDFCTAINVQNYWQIVWISSMVFMFGVYVFS
jgi:hypothetical protein